MRHLDIRDANPGNRFCGCAETIAPDFSKSIQSTSNLRCSHSIHSTGTSSRCKSTYPTRLYNSIMSGNVTRCFPVPTPQPGLLCNLKYRALSARSVVTPVYRQHVLSSGKPMILTILHPQRFVLRHSAITIHPYQSVHSHHKTIFDRHW